MLQDLMNMEGVAVLSKQQQIAIQGSGSCRFTYIGSGGTREVETVNVTLGLSNSISDVGPAQGRCADAIASGWSRCFYNCAYDD